MAKLSEIDEAVNICRKNKVMPRRILLSFAPVSSQKNIDFLKWLGVEIPFETERYLQGRPGSMTERSLDVAIEVLKIPKINT